MENKDVFIKKLRSSGLRPTRQRIEICKALYDRKKTFHFTISDLAKILKSKSKGQYSYSTTRPGVTRGDHFHMRKIERFSWS